MTAPPVQLCKKTSAELLADMRDLLNSRDADACKSEEELAQALSATVFDVAACRAALIVENEMLT